MASPTPSFASKTIEWVIWCRRRPVFTKHSRSLIPRPGIIRIGFDDLRAALRSPNGRCLFGFGESDSDNRAHDALNQALKSPLMDRGRLLGDADHVLVQVAGGPGMTLSEVEIVMQELGRHVRDHTQI